MSRCNIVHPERDEKYRRYHDQIAEIELKLKRMEMRAVSAEEQLAAIFEHIRQQVTVWLDYPDNKRIYLVGSLDEPPMKNEPMI